MPVYIICLEKPLGSEKHKASHYIGYSPNTRTLYNRLKQHFNGRGSAFTRAAYEKGIKFKVTAIYSGDRITERKMKNQKNHKKFCPNCTNYKPKYRKFRNHRIIMENFNKC